MPLHLANTLVLLACLTLTAHWLSGGAPISLKERGRHLWILVALLIAMIGVGKTGAIAALGDTLYPASSFLEGVRADMSATASLLLRLRILHPALGVVVGMALVFGLGAIPIAGSDRRGRALRLVAAALAVFQMLLGFVNVWLAAPVWLQLPHLLVADLLWITLVLVAASILARRDAGQMPVRP